MDVQHEFADKMVLSMAEERDKLCKECDALAEAVIEAKHSTTATDTAGDASVEADLAAGAPLFSEQKYWRLFLGHEAPVRRCYMSEKWSPCTDFKLFWRPCGGQIILEGRLPSRMMCHLKK